jgi:hypothetical protein
MATNISKAFETATKGGVLAIAFEDGQCLEGCGEATAKGRKFKQGHDARLRGMLGRASLAGIPVTVNGKSTTADAQLKAHGFPIPAPRKPRKAAAKKSTAKKSTAKKSTAKRTTRKRTAAKPATQAS